MHAFSHANYAQAQEATIQGFIDHAKKQGAAGKPLTVASAGSGSPPHLFMEPALPNVPTVAEAGLGRPVTHRHDQGD